MGFWKKLLFWRRRNVTVTTCDIATMMEDVTSENGTQVSTIEMKMRCNAGTQVDFNISCEVYTQTPDGNEQPEKRTHVGAAGKDKKQLHCRSY